MTTYTRAQIETLLINRTGTLLTFVGKDGTTVSGTNADLNDAIGAAIRIMEGVVVNPSLVTDTDVQTVDAADFDALLDLAELRLYYSIRGNLTAIDTTAGPFSEKYSNIGDYLKEQIRALSRLIEDLYGIGSPEMEAGVITIDIASHDEDEI